jgi:hypothetical protein
VFLIEALADFVVSMHKAKIGAPSLLKQKCFTTPKQLTTNALANTLRQQIDTKEFHALPAGTDVTKTTIEIFK